MARELSKSLILDGVAASEAIDSSGEQLLIDGLDISELEQQRGVLNFEHRGEKDEGASANDIIGAITYAKKIFSEKDCANDRQRSYWDRVKLPFLYIQAELFDAENHPGAVAAAALIRYYNRRKLPILMRYSIEGSTLERDGNVLKRCVARRVAATLKPCNRTCFSGVLSDSATDESSADSLESLARSEHPTRQLLGFYELEVNPVVADPVELLKNSLETLREMAALTKAITAGGYNGAPDTLTGGSALQCEEVSPEKERTLRNRSLAALRDWDRRGDFRTFLKSRLQDASESFINHFVGLVDDFHLRKQQTLEGDLWKALQGKIQNAHKPTLDRLRELNIQLQKATEPPAPVTPVAPAPQPQQPQLHPLNSSIPAGLHKFRDMHVTPGEVEITHGIYTGSKLRLMGQHGEHLYVKPKQASPDDAVSLQKLPIVDLGRTYKMTAPPRTYVAPELVDANQHAVDPHNRSFEQKALVHGMDLKRRVQGVESEAEGMSSRNSPDQSGWFESAHGKTAYVKPGPAKHTWDWGDKGWSNPELHEQFSVPHREALYHNLAHDFFGMGAHVPTTSVFNHPTTNEPMSAMERLHEASHFDSDNDDHGFAISQAGNSGALDKLAMMDIILGQHDRHHGNYMMTDQAPYVHHIDNGLMFNHSPAEHNHSEVPGYLENYFKNSTHSDYYSKMEESPIHPHAAQWVLGLNSEDLHNRLVQAGVPAPFARASKHKLEAFQQMMWKGDHPTRGEMLEIGKT